MRNKVVLLIGLIIGVFATHSHGQTDWSKVEIKATKVGGNVYMLEGAGGNIGVSVGPDGILIVDDQYAPLADKIKAALKAVGRGQAQVCAQYTLAWRSHRR